MLRAVLFVMLFFMLHPAIAQDEEIIAEGKVVDASTGKAIRADIRYSSIPTGSLFGRFKDSTFTFSIYGYARYQITARAEGYNPRTVIVNPQEITDGKKLRRDILLTPEKQTIVLRSLIFDRGKAHIDPSSYTELDELAQLMKENPKMEIQLEGHTDNVGNPKANLKLSEERVEAVKRYLAVQGVSKNRIKTKAFGGTKPLRNEMTPEDRALNRRVEVRILND